MPTFADKWTQIANAIHVFQEAQEWATVDATNLVGLIDAHKAAISGDFSVEAAAALDRFRATYAGLLSPATIRGVLNGHILDLGEIVDSPGTTTARIFSDLRRYMIDNTQSVKTRGITFGSVSAGGSNVGNGTVYRITTDRDTQAIEAVHLDTVTIKCIADQNMGPEPGREQYEIRQGDPGPDVLQIRGNGRIGTTTALAGDIILSNSSFGVLDGTIAVPTSIPDWTFTAGAVTDVTLDESVTFRKSPDEGTARSLRTDAAANISIKQTLSSVGGDLDRSVPYLLLVRWNTQGSGYDGTLTIRYGAANAAKVFSGSEVAGWNTLALTIDQTLWPDNATEADLDIALELTGATTGRLNLDDVIFAGAVSFDNLGYWIVGGSTADLVDDVYTFSDALAGADGVIQSWLWRGYNTYLPSSGSPTISDP